MTWKRPVISGGVGSCVPVIAFDCGRGRGGIKSAAGVTVAPSVLTVPVQQDSVIIHMEEGLCGRSRCRFLTNIWVIFGADHAMEQQLLNYHLLTNIAKHLLNYGCHDITLLFHVHDNLCTYLHRRI
jgi:hypothetical protein